MAMIRSHPSIGYSPTGAVGPPIPALFTAMSSLPYSRTACSTRAFAASALDTSVSTTRPCPPAFSISPRTRSAPSMSRSARTTVAPLFANRIAMASPRPDPAPVTTAIFPSSICISSGVVSTAFGVGGLVPDAATKGAGMPVRAFAGGRTGSGNGRRFAAPPLAAHRSPTTAESISCRRAVSGPAGLAAVVRAAIRVDRDDAPGDHQADDAGPCRGVARAGGDSVLPDELQLSLDADLVGDQHAAGLQRLVPPETPVLAV